MNAKMKKSLLLATAWSILTTVSPAHSVSVMESRGQSSSRTITVYRSPSCGCCGAWMNHLRQSGFEVVENQSDDMKTIKQRHQIPQNLRSCHTATIDGYVIEGHVPAREIQRLLRERPKVAGLAVPGMPSGSPGMEMGNRKEPFSVLRFTSMGETGVYQNYPPLQ